MRALKGALTALVLLTGLSPDCLADYMIYGQGGDATLSRPFCAS